MSRSDLRYFHWCVLYVHQSPHHSMILVKVDISYRNIQCWEISSLDFVLRNVSLSPGRFVLSEPSWPAWLIKRLKQKYFHVKAFFIWTEMLVFSLSLTVWSLTLCLSLHLQLVDCSDFAEDLAQCAAAEPLNKCLVKVSWQLVVTAHLGSLWNIWQDTSPPSPLTF